MNSIHPAQRFEMESSSSLLPTTLFLTFMAVGYSLFYMKKKLDELTVQKKDIDEEDSVEPDVYQSWSGTYADGEDSLIITIVREKIHPKKKNIAWMDWDGTTDSSVISRNFYLGNSDPSFIWSLEKRDFDTKAWVSETMIDGWESVVRMKLTAFMRDEISSERMNVYLKSWIENEKIDWQKTLLTKQEFEAIFN